MGQSHTAHPHSHPHNESSAGEAGPTMGVCPQGKARPTGPDTEITDALCMLTCTQASSTKGESGSLLRCDPRDPTGRAPASAVGGTWRGRRGAVFSHLPSPGEALGTGSGWLGPRPWGSLPQPSKEGAQGPPEDPHSWDLYPAPWLEGMSLVPQPEGAADPGPAVGQAHTCAPALGQPGWAVVLTGLTGLKTVGISSTATVDKGVTGLRAP